MEIINENLILIDESFQHRKEVIQKIGKVLLENDRINNLEDFSEDIMKREEEMSTSMGLGVAIPHTQSTSVKTASLVFIKVKKGMQWNEDKDIKIVFGIAVPKDNQNNEHLKILSLLARNLMKKDFREKLNLSKTKEDVLSILKQINI